MKSPSDRVDEAGVDRAVEREFPMGAAETADGMDRRTFVQLLGTSLALSGLAGCPRAPPEKILPYTRQPPDLTPGNPLHYATAFATGAYATGVLATSWEGRPTKIEGNPLHPSSRGAAGLFEQASILQLYDPQRARLVKYKGVARAWKSFLAETRQRLDYLLEANRAAGLRFLLDPSGSPTVEDLRRRIAAAFPNARFHAYEALDRDNAYQGARLAFGRPLETLNEFENADVILSLDADFLQCVGPHLRHSRQFAARRAPGPAMNRLYAVESMLSVTGTMADHRLRLRSSEIQSFALELLSELVGKHRLGALAAIASALGQPLDAGPRAAWVRAVAADLARHPGRSSLVVGPRQPALVHAIGHAINSALGNFEQTVRFTRPVPLEAEAGSAALAALAAEIRDGRVDTLVITSRNPAYTAPANLEFPSLLSSIPNVIYHGWYEDETWARSAWTIPAAHPLETWSDARAHDGTISIAQPLIAPLFNGIPELELLASFVGEVDKNAYQILRESWQKKTPAADFEQRWERWLADGLVPGTAFSPERPSVRWDALNAAIRGAGKQDAAAPPGQRPLEVNFVGDYKVYDGRFANNAWLQELPDPITKLAWDNAALLSPATAQRLGLGQGEVVTLELRGRRVDAPVFMVPGHADDAVTLPLGYGRSGMEGVARGMGFNAYLLRHASAPWFDSGLTITSRGKHHPLAVTHDHWSMEGRPLALQSTLAEFQKNPGALDELRGPTETFHRPVDYDQAPHRWAMAIDLSRCTGCSACVVACQSENNIPVVGREQVRRSREMHWLRIDRYFSGPIEEPSVITQPVACVHCELAPCEYVCPVNATVHSDEGLNEMVYNRCVGTRYCSNNCPYKVRRFNYLHYTQDKPAPEKLMMNPDVTVRARGVMEKCTYCVQRIERVRIQSRIENRPIRDGELQTACQQACPAEAITFGSLHDQSSRVSRLHRDPRRYDLLHDLGTRPRTAYLVRIKNPNPELA